MYNFFPNPRCTITFLRKQESEEPLDSHKIIQIDLPARNLGDIVLVRPARCTKVRVTFPNSKEAGTLQIKIQIKS